VSDAEFRSRMDQILRMLKATPPAPGAPRVMAPGEIELANEARALTEGIALATEIAAQLAEFGNGLGIPFPSPVRVPAQS
jgi:LDH2 family malate/lactate/ureidoglycolate dehydrogenase